MDILITVVYVAGMLITGHHVEQRHTDWSKNGMTAAALLWPLYWWKRL